MNALSLFGVFIILIVLISGAIWFFDARNKRTLDKKTKGLARNTTNMQNQTIAEDVMVFLDHLGEKNSTPKIVTYLILVGTLVAALATAVSAFLSLQNHP